MNKIIFVDTSGLIALLESDEVLCKQAAELFKDYSEQGYKLVTTDYVIDELLTWMRCKKKMNIDRVLTFVKQIYVSDVEILGITRDIFGDALKIMKKYEDQYFSLTDCISFVVMKDLKTKEVFTTDKHFAIVGYNILLKM